MAIKAPCVTRVANCRGLKKNKPVGINTIYESTEPVHHEANRSTRFTTIYFPYSLITQ